MTLYLQPENRAVHDKLTFGMILAAAVSRKRKVNNKKDKVYQESIKTDNDQDFQDNRYNPEQLFFEVSNYNELKRKIINT